MEKTVVPNQSQNNSLEEEENLKINPHTVFYAAYIFMLRLDRNCFFKVFA